MSLSKLKFSALLLCLALMSACSLVLEEPLEYPSEMMPVDMYIAPPPDILMGGDALNDLSGGASGAEQKMNARKSTSPTGSDDAEMAGTEMAGATP